MNIILLGPPGAGKGTVAGNIKDGLDLMHLSTGDMLRSEIKKGSELGLAAKSLIDKGELVPDEVIIGMVSSTIDAAKSGILFDGFPRTVAQAKALAEIGDIDAVIMLDADEDLVTQRICSRRICSQCGAVYNLALLKGDKCEACAGELIQRADDSEETARERFQVYMKNTQPLVDFYREQGILHVVDANRTAKEVAADVVRILSEQK